MGIVDDSEHLMCILIRVARPQKVKLKWLKGMHRCHVSRYLIHWFWIEIIALFNHRFLRFCKMKFSFHKSTNLATTHMLYQNIMELWIKRRRHIVFAIYKWCNRGCRHKIEDVVYFHQVGVDQFFFLHSFVIWPLTTLH